MKLFSNNGEQLERVLSDPFKFGERYTEFG